MNRLIFPKSPHRREGLAPRCRLIISWGGSTSQGLGCSPIKMVRELGSERRFRCVNCQQWQFSIGYIGGVFINNDQLI